MNKSLIGQAKVLYYITDATDRYDAKDYMSAIKYADKALEVDPLYKKAWKIKGLSFKFEGNFEKADFCLAKF